MKFYGGTLWNRGRDGVTMISLFFFLRKEFYLGAYKTELDNTTSPNVHIYLKKFRVKFLSKLNVSRRPLNVGDFLVYG